MRLAVYGGSFNPPHPAHVRAARLAYEALAPELMLIIPAADPPHKRLDPGSPDPSERLELTRLAFRDFPQARVCDMELRREGESYSADTMRQLLAEYPGAEAYFIVGADMLLYFEKWHDFRWLLENVSIAALSRENGDQAEMSAFAEHLRREYGARVLLLSAAPMPMSSSMIRRELVSRRGAEILDEGVYRRIIRLRDYGARPELSWLRRQAYVYLKPKRVPHVQGTEAEAVALSERWGADPGDAAEAAILHDITKKLSLDEQLQLGEKYDIVFDNLEKQNLKLLHSKTGAYLARELFGVPEDIFGAVYWHTTGRPAMTLLEKIIYLADYIEPNRDFPGVGELRRLAYEDLDSAMALGLKMSLDDLRENNIEPYPATCQALEWYRKDE